MYILLCSCIAALLTQKTGTKFHVLIVRRPEISGRDYSTPLQLRTVPTYPAFVMASPLSCDTVALWQWALKTGNRALWNVCVEK